jgi:hypothetical protein
VKKLVSIVLNSFRTASRNSRSGLLRQKHHGPLIIALLINSTTYNILSTGRAY